MQTERKRKNQWEKETKTFFPIMLFPITFSFSIFIKYDDDWKFFLRFPCKTFKLVLVYWVHWMEITAKRSAFWQWQRFLFEIPFKIKNSEHSYFISIISLISTPYRQYSRARFLLLPSTISFLFSLTKSKKNLRSHPNSIHVSLKFPL